MSVQLDSSNFTLPNQKKMLQGLILANQYNWTNAIESFAAVDTKSKFLGNARQCEDICREGSLLRLKNPTLAGILGVVPGLGYLYDGYPQTALSAFIVNALFFWGTYEAFDHGNEAVGVILGFFGFGWYVGNICLGHYRT